MENFYSTGRFMYSTFYIKLLLRRKSLCFLSLILSDERKFSRLAEYTRNSRTTDEFSYIERSYVTPSWTSFKPGPIPRDDIGKRDNGVDRTTTGTNDDDDETDSDGNSVKLNYGNCNRIAENRRRSSRLLAPPPPCNVSDK